MGSAGLVVPSCQCCQFLAELFSQSSRKLGLLRKKRKVLGTFNLKKLHEKKL
jgi:hypothetical protein